METTRNDPYLSAISAIFNAISTRPRDYHELIAEMRERRPRLGTAAVDKALWSLITTRRVTLTDDGLRRWWARG